jgi:UDP-N-acetylmuramoyl-L-alanyl-D-glutamate--2,6-diaminopimelate ligase
MAEAVARFADRIIATSDNPRTEDPERILTDVEKGLSGRERVGVGDLATSEGAYAVLPDRREAIAVAVSIARSGDIVVVAGKGHEDYQIIGRERLPFSDVDESRRALAAWGER